MIAINICAPSNLDPYDSYGHLALETARHLSRLGVYVNLLPMGKREMDTQDEELAAIVRQPIRAALGSIMLGYPTAFKGHQNPLAHLGPRIAITMFESSKIPSTWIEPLNNIDTVIVPSAFCKRVFADCGVSAPIHVVPLGIGETFQYAERDPNRPLTFLTFGDRGARKGGIVALKAFQMAFGEDTNYRLIFKMRKPKNKDLTVTIEDPNIELIQQDMTEQELYQLYLECDVMIAANKGEGFGILPRQHACTGGIALATDWGGTADDIDLWGLPLPYTLERADWNGIKKFEDVDLGEWARVDPLAVAEKLRTIAANRDYYRGVGKLYAERARTLYSWQTFAERVLAIWEGVAVTSRERMTA